MYGRLVASNHSLNLNNKLQLTVRVDTEVKIIYILSKKKEN